MNKEKLVRIKERVEETYNHADKILMGDADNYDGADGAREVKCLCYTCLELIKELENSYDKTKKD